MKKTFKKAVSILCVLAMMLSFVGTTAFAAGNGRNIAPLATPHDNADEWAGNRSDPLENLIDGNEDKRWTADTTHGNGTSGNWKVWLEWDEPQNFNLVRIKWEVCYAKAFTLEYSNDFEQWTTIYSGNAGSSGWKDYQLPETVTAKYVRVAITEKDNEWGVAIWEMEVYDPTANVYLTDDLEDAILAAEAGFGTHMVNAYGYNATAWSEYLTAYSAAKTAFAACDGGIDVDPDSAYPDQEALDEITAALNTAVANLIGDGTASGNNALRNGIMYYDPENLSSHCGDINYRSVTDGLWANDENNWQPDPNKSTGSVLYVGLVTPADLNKLVLYTESASSNMTIEYTTDPVKGIGGYDAYGELNWNTLCETDDADSFRYSYSVVSSVAVHSYAFATVEDVTAIKVIYNGGSWFKIREILGYNDQGDDNHVTEILGDAFTGTVNGATAKFFCTNVSPEALKDKGSIEAVCTLERDGRTEVKTVYITEAYSVITLGEYNITSESFDGGHAGDYVVGILFENFKPGDKISVTFDGKSGNDTVGTTPAEPAAVPEGNATTYGISVSDLDGDGVIRVACVGDSITAGSSTVNWPLYLSEALRELSKIDGNTYEVMNFGKGSAAVHHILENCDGNGDGVKNPEGEYFWYDSWQYNDSLAYAADVVLVQMGTNDSWSGESYCEPYFKEDYYTYMVKPYLDNGAKVIVAPPSYANGLSAVNGFIRDTVLEIAEEHDLDVVDINKFTYGIREAFGDGFNWDVHGNETGYSIMAQAYYKYVFRGQTITATVTAVPDALVKAYDVETGRTYMVRADENGEAEFSFIAGCKYYLAITATCDGYEDCVGNQLILDGADGDLTLTMTAE